MMIQHVLPRARRRFTAVWMCLCLSVAVSGTLAAMAAPELGPTGPALENRQATAIDGYHNFESLTNALREIVADHPDLARLSSLGKTIEGRDIWLVEVGSRGGEPLDERPALLVGANFGADQLVGGELSLKVIRYLVDHYASDGEIAERLDAHTFYFIPRANPDGAERMFASVQTGQRTNASPRDDDNDGRIDEDPPDDLDGNGMITLMRAADPAGAYMIDPDDERAMKMADPKKGESGGYTVYWEGLDDDGDGFYNEDALGGVNLNRNFQHAYPYYERYAGIHMVSEKESRAVMDFVIAHRNIAVMLVYGSNDNLITAPNNRGELAGAENIDMYGFAESSYADASTVGTFTTSQRSFFRGRFGSRGSGQQTPSSGSRRPARRPETTVNKDDLDYFTAVSRKYRELTGITRAPGIDKPAGALFEYGYYQFGVPSFSTPGWGLPEAADTSATRSARSQRGDGNGPGASRPARAGARPGESKDGSLDRLLLAWMDGAGVDGFVPWTPFEHPTLGKVEIGGFKPYAAVNPPADVLDDLGEKQASFVVYLSSLFADVRIARTEVTDHGGGVFRIKADVENDGFLPTATAHGVVSRSVRPTMVQLGIEPERLLSGDAKTSFFQAMNGSGNRRSFEWLVSGRKGERIELKVVSQKGGRDAATITLE